MCMHMHSTVYGFTMVGSIFSSKLEKEKKQQARDVGMTKTEVSGAEVLPVNR